MLTNLYNFVLRWLFLTNYKDIGFLYIIFGFFSSVIGVIMAVLSHMEFTYPENHQLYNIVVTGHALIMILFSIVPVLIGGFGNILVPLMIGASEVAFPRINKISFWLLPLSLILLFSSVLVEAVAGAGPAVGLAIFSLYLSGAALILGAINLIMTVFYMRAPEITMHRIPVLVWLLLGTAFLLLFLLPVLIVQIDCYLTLLN